MAAALITGASSGIGKEFAELCARDHRDLVLVARSGDRLTELGERLAHDHGVGVTVIPLDLAEHGAPETVLKVVEAKGLEVDLLINNAGFGLKGAVAELGAAEQAGMLELNVVALTVLTRLFLDGMRARGRGAILNVASTAGFQPGPLMAVYYASKAYVLSFTEALANELAGSGVTATALCPGPTVTGFSARAGTAGTKLFRGPKMGARAVAEAGYAAMQAGRPVVIPGLRNKVLAFGVRLGPRKWVTQIARGMQETRR
ncbi:MAG TPA: SDR family oxidoreductase [Actinomycetota bacterium]|nr:SDR family oxidoreductase [Actinomycetota bacterium]